MTRACVLLVFVLAPIVRADEGGDRPGPPVHVVRPTASRIVIDGVLDDDAWRDATTIPLRYEWAPGDNVAPPVSTECRVTFDSRHLLVACRAEDPDPAALRASLADRDRIDSDDQIVLWIDASHDRRTAYRFAVNPFGVQADALVLQGGRDDGWDTIWESAARVDDDGWSAEVAIPFRSLQFEEGAGEWGFVVERVWPRAARHRFGNVPLPRDETCFLCGAAVLSGFAGIRGGHEIEIDPALIALSSRPDADGKDVDEVDAGVTAQWNVSPSLRLSATMHPDFSQVEADADELDVNERFSLRFPEKRPFFTEGEDVFDTFGNLELAFTRTVADPAAGFKATGKNGRHAYGALVTADRTNNVLLPGREESDLVTRRETVGGAMFRYRLDVGRSSSVGMIGTARRADTYGNAVGGWDGLLRLDRHRLRWLAAVSRTEYPGSFADDVERTGAPIDGAAGYVRYDFDSRAWSVEASYRATGDDFRADAGFVPRVGVRGPEVQVARSFWGDHAGWFDRIDLAVEVQDLRDTDGGVLDRKVGAGASYVGPAQTEVDAELYRRRNRFEGREFDLVGAELDAAATPTPLVDVGVSLAVGDEIDADGARKGQLADLGLSTALRSGHRLRFAGSYRWQRLWVDGRRLYSAHLPQGQAEYHFVRDVFLRTIAQVRILRRDPDLFPEAVAPRSRRVLIQLLFAWRTNPRTVLFAGYSDRQQGEDGWRRTGRTVFLKLAYAWQP